MIKVLQEEAQDTRIPRRVSVLSDRNYSKSLCVLSGGFRGTGGATSLKEELVERVPVLCDSGSFREVRRIFREDYSGCKTLKAELSYAGFIDTSTGLLTTGTKPFNLFARIAAGSMEQPGREVGVGTCKAKIAGWLFAWFRACDNKKRFIVGHQHSDRHLCISRM